MLGNGRPFILELLDAKRTVPEKSTYEEIMTSFNTKNEGIVQIRNVEIASKEDFVQLQLGADAKRKTYWYERRIH